MAGTVNLSAVSEVAEPIKKRETIVARRTTLSDRVLSILQNSDVIRYKKKNNIMEDVNFKDSCARAGIPATRRQAAKWLNKRGAAWANRKK